MKKSKIAQTTQTDDQLADRGVGVLGLGSPIPELEAESEVGWRIGAG